MELQRLSHLIELVYDTAADVDLWPALLSGLTDEMQHTQQTNTVPLSAQAELIHQPGEFVDAWYSSLSQSDTSLGINSQLRHFDKQQSAMMQLMLPHLLRAIRINQNFAETHAQNEIAMEILAHLPIAIAVTDQAGRIQSTNPRMEQLLLSRGGLQQSDGILCALQEKDDRLLHELISEVASQGNVLSELSALKLTGDKVGSLLVMPLNGADLNETSGHVMVVMTDTQREQDISPEFIQAHLGLTPAEARLTFDLVNGLSLQKIAQTRHVSRNTLATHLKSIFKKTGCHRQSELVAMVLSHNVETAGLSAKRAAIKPVMNNLMANHQEVYDRSIHLSDGRRLSFADYGPDDGIPVLMMHGLTGSRSQVHPDEGILLRNQVRLIIPERPGYGNSDSVDERDFISWCDDLRELLDHLCLSQVKLIGYSVGGIYALAAAHQMPLRIQRVYLISPMGEYHRLSDLDGMLPMYRMLLALVRYTPAVVMPMVRMMLRSARKNPQLYFESTLGQATQMDRDVLSLPEISFMSTRSLMEAFCQGERDVLLEQLLISRKWGFDVSDIKIPIDIWHGEMDRHVPLHMAQALHAKLPDSRLRVIPGAGHFLIFRFWQDIISSIASREEEISDTTGYAVHS